MLVIRDKNITEVSVNITIYLCKTIYSEDKRNNDIRGYLRRYLRYENMYLSDLINVDIDVDGSPNI